MKTSTKMIVLFTVIAALMIGFNSYLAIRSELDMVRSNIQDNLTTIADKMLTEIEQNISLMEYGIESMAQDYNFMSALNVIHTLGEAGENTPEYHRAQTTLSTSLFHQPLNDNFYRVNIMTNEGFFLSSHLQKTETFENYSDEIRERVAVLHTLHPVSQKKVVCPHIDPWSVNPRASVYTVSAPAIFNGKQIGYLEVNSLTSELSDIFSASGMAGFAASAIFDPSDSMPNCTLYRSDNNTIDYSGVVPGVMTQCTDADGVAYGVMATYSRWLKLTVYAAQRTDAYTTPMLSVLRYHLAVSLTLLSVAIVITVLLSLQLTRSMRKLTKKMAETKESTSLNHFTPTLVTSTHDPEARELENVFNDLLINLQKSTHMEMELREATLRSHLNALQAQINPHFVYNTLNVISAKSMQAGNEEIIDICDRFAQMLRYSTDLRSKTATLAEEVENARSYLLLSKVRYEEHLEFTIDIPSDFDHIILPKLTLQPICENAISHGFSGARSVMRIALWVEKDPKGFLHLYIRDNGNGFEPIVLSRLREEFAQIESGPSLNEENTSAHIGLVNTYRRLFYFSRGLIRMRLKNDDGAVVELIVDNQLQGG